MFSEQRQAAILERLNQNGSVSLGELIGALSVSEATVRRDLSELEARGMLRRTHGGAVSMANSLSERDYGEAEASNVSEKCSIALVAASLVNDGDTVLLDSGTTTHQIALSLAGRDITIITNSITIPPEGVDFKPVLYLAGGLCRLNTKSTVGPNAEAFIRSLRPDKAFIAANGILKDEFFTPHLSESEIKRSMIAVAKEKYLVADHTKFGKSYLSAVAEVSQFDAIITDDNISDETANYYRSRHIPVLSEKNYLMDKD